MPDLTRVPHSACVTSSTQPLPKGHTVFAYVADGEAGFGCGSYNSPATVRERTVAVFDDGDYVSAITDNSTARFLRGRWQSVG